MRFTKFHKTQSLINCTFDYKLKFLIFRYFILLLFFSAVNFLLAQEPVSIHLSEENGLPDIEFYSMLEDNNGYMWLAANKGLFRYDGKEFKAFTNPKKRGRSFFNLKLDKHGNVWCNNIAGQFFRVKNDSLELFIDYKDELAGVLSDYLFFKNDIVFNTRGKLFFVDIDSKDKNVLQNYTNGTSIGFVTDSNKLMILDSTFNLKLKDSRNTSDILKSPKISKNIKDEELSFTSFYKNDDSDVLLFQNKFNLKNKLFLFNDNILKPLKLPEYFNTVYIDHIFTDGNKWFFSTTNGVFKCILIKSEIQITQHYFKNEHITSIVKDFNNNLWFSTLKNGVYVVPNENIIFYPKFEDVTAVEKRNDSIIYVGQNSGKLMTLNLNTGLIDNHHLTSSSVVRQLHYDNKKLFFASDQATFLYNENSGIERRYNNIAALKSVDKISDTSYVFGKHFESIIINSHSENLLLPRRTYKVIYSENNKSILVSSVNGLDKFDYPLLNRKALSFKDQPIYALDLAESENNMFWAATYNQGVFGIRDTEVVKHIKTKDGLASNTINRIAADGNNLWIATDSGLQFYDTASDTFKTLSRLNGLNSYNINQLEVLKNHVVFSSNLGLFSIKKENVFQAKKVPKVEITSVVLNELPAELKTRYKLKQTESEIAITFHSKGFQSNKTTDYYYVLEGFDDNWKKVDEVSQQVKYNSLPAGNFNFKVKAKNKFSEEFSEPAVFTIKVFSPFYKTWWFWTIVFFATVALVIWYFKNQTNRLKKEQTIALEKAKISKDLVFSQLENLRSQMNPHFIFNALNSIQDYIISNEKKLARQYLVKFSRLIRTYLEHSRTSEISLTEELHALNLYLELEKDRFDDDFQFDIQVDKTLNTENVKVPSLLIQPYVENALKHGLLHKENNKKLQLKFTKSQTDSIMLCTIEDNGIGRIASAVINKKRINHKSFATSANKKRINLINKSKQSELSVETNDLYDANDKPIGTKVLIKIPL